MATSAIGTEANAGIGHPYARISDPEQRKGGGLVRQTTCGPALEMFCQQFKFTLSKRILVDDGVSAWKGLNASPNHALGKFLSEARKGLIRPGDCLLIENYDRLSRQDPWAAIGLVNELRQLGIHVGRLDRMKLLRADSTDPGDFFEAAIEFMRGNSESEAKSMRNSARWKYRREAAREGKGILTHKLPAWVEEHKGKLRLIPERAKVVRRIFELSVAGYGLAAIRRRLADDGVPAFGPSGRWSISYIDLILKDRRALGEFQMKRGEEEDGEPIPDYFPAVVREEVFQLARQGARARHRKPGSTGFSGRIAERINLFQGLVRGALDGEPYIIGSESSNNPHATLRSTAARKGTGKTDSFPLWTFERAILTCLREINPHDILNGNQPADDTLVLAAQLAGVDERIAELEAELLKGDVPSLARVLRTLETQRKELAEKLAEARMKAAHPLSESWGEMGTLLDVVDKAADAKEVRMRLRGALRQIVQSILIVVAKSGRDRLCYAHMRFAGHEQEPVEGCHSSSCFRNYFIIHRPPKANARVKVPGRWYVSAIKHPGDNVPLGDEDLSNLDEAENVKSFLEAYPKDIIDRLLAQGLPLP